MAPGADQQRTEADGLRNFGDAVMACLSCRPAGGRCRPADPPAGAHHAGRSPSGAEAPVGQRDSHTSSNRWVRRLWPPRHAEVATRRTRNGPPSGPSQAAAIAEGSFPSRTADRRQRRNHPRIETPMPLEEPPLLGHQRPRSGASRVRPARPRRRRYRRDRRCACGAATIGRARCRTLAERALADAGRPPRPRRVRNQAYLDLLRSRQAVRQATTTHRLGLRVVVDACPDILIVWLSDSLQ